MQYNQAYLIVEFLLFEKEKITFTNWYHKFSNI